MLGRSGKFEYDIRGRGHHIKPEQLQIARAPR